MRTGVSIDISASDRLRLEAVVRDRNAAQKHVWRAAIVLLSGDGIGTHEIMRQTGTSKTCVWRWQERFAEEGVDGLLRDKTRPSRLAPLSPEVAARVVGLTLEAPPGETTHWTAAAMATATAISVGSVQRIWRKHGLQPHRIRTFSSPTTSGLPRSCAMSSVSMSTRRPMRCCFPLMKNRRYRRSTARSRACP